jgi:tetratricopeptide (TPR) repeat protein
MSLSKPLDKVMELRDKEGKPKVALKELLKYKNEDFKEYDELIKYVLMKAVLYRDTGDMESSVETYKEALSIVKDDDHINKADILRSLSFVSIYTEGFEKAYEYALDALNTVKDKRGKKYYRVKSNIYAVIGNILYGEEEYEKALINYKKGMYWAEKDHFYQREITLGGDIAMYILHKEIFKAIYYLKNLKLPKKSYRISVPQLYLKEQR